MIHIAPIFPTYIREYIITGRSISLIVLEIFNQTLSRLGSSLYLAIPIRLHRVCPRPYLQRTQLLHNCSHLSRSKEGKRRKESVRWENLLLGRGRKEGRKRRAEQEERRDWNGRSCRKCDCARLLTHHHEKVISLLGHVTRALTNSAL